MEMNKADSGNNHREKLRYVIGEDIFRFTFLLCFVEKLGNTLGNLSRGRLLILCRQQRNKKGSTESVGPPVFSYLC